MGEILLRFLSENFDKLFYMTVAFLLGCLLMSFGLKMGFDEGTSNTMIGAGLAVVIGVAQFATNKIRSPKKEQLP